MLSTTTMTTSSRSTSRPKLSLAVPTPSTSAASKRPTLSLTVPAAARSPLPPTRSPLPPTRSPLPRSTASSSSKKKASKRVQFREEADVKCVTPLPEECYGAFVKMGREERRWARAAAAYE